MSLRTRPDPLPSPVGPGPALRSRIPLSRVPQPREDRMVPTWRLAKPGRIAAALQVAQAQDSGGWFVAGASDEVGTKESVARTIAGREVVFWRSSTGGLVAGPAACPHLGALLDRCPVMDGTMYCRWHGLALTQQGDATWQPYRAFDDGVLIWVGLPTRGESETDKPVLAFRPPVADAVTAVIAQPGICEPQDVIANRLDPWHGSWYHPYAFSHLVVDAEASNEQVLVVDVTFRLSRTWGVPVRAEFSCPDTRTIVMRIVDGEGAGSVVETHATPLGMNTEGRPLTMVTEATIAYSDRPGFAVARWMSPLLKPGIRRTARKLWVDDLAYAERRYELRQRGEFPG
jgi:nitrite reductase/ring-hydroxylating ferredoxin subunit